MSEERAYKAEESAKLKRELGSSPWPAILVIALGAILLVANLFDFHLINVLWPGFIIAPGLMLIWPAYDSTEERGNVLSFLAVPGAVVTMVGLMLFVMDVTNHYEAWAYSWALLPAAAMGGLMYAKRFDTGSNIHEVGRKMIRAMVIMFIALAIFFEIIVFANFNPWLPLALIGYGIYLLVKDQRDNE
jgi:hypothetical protein